MPLIYVGIGALILGTGGGFVLGSKTRDLATLAGAGFLVYLLVKK